MLEENPGVWCFYKHGEILLCVKSTEFKRTAEGLCHSQRRDYQRCWQPPAARAVQSRASSHSQHRATVAEAPLAIFKMVQGNTGLKKSQ